MFTSHTYTLGSGFNTVTGAEANLAIELPSDKSASAPSARSKKSGSSKGGASASPVNLHIHLSTPKKDNKAESEVSSEVLSSPVEENQKEKKTAQSDFPFWVEYKPNREVKSITKTYTSLHEVQRAYSGSLNISTPGIATANIDFSQIVKKTAYEFYYILELTCMEYELVLKRPFKFNTEAETLLTSPKGGASFFFQYGDSFFDRLIYGRRALVIVQISASSVEEQQKAKLSFSGGMGQVSGGADVSAKVKKAFSRHDATVYQYTAGLNYGASGLISTPKEVEELIKNFDVDGKLQVPAVQIGWTTVPYRLACKHDVSRSVANHMEESVSIARKLNQLLKKYQEAVKVYQHALKLDVINSQLLFSVPASIIHHDFLKDHVALKALEQAFSQISGDIVTNALGESALKEIGGRIRGMGIYLEKIRQEFPVEWEEYFIPVAQITDEKINTEDHNAGQYAGDIFSIPIISGVELIKFEVHLFDGKVKAVRSAFLMAVSESISAAKKAMDASRFLSSPDKQAETIIYARMGIIYANQAEEMLRVIKRYGEFTKEDDLSLSLAKKMLEICELMKLAPKNLSVNRNVFVFPMAGLLEQILDKGQSTFYISFNAISSALMDIKKLFSGQKRLAGIRYNRLYLDKIKGFSEVAESLNRFVSEGKSIGFVDFSLVLEVLKLDVKNLLLQAMNIVGGLSSSSVSVRRREPFPILKDLIETIGSVENQSPNEPLNKDSLLSMPKINEVKKTLSLIILEISKLKMYLEGVLSLVQKIESNVTLAPEPDKKLTEDLKKLQYDLEEALVSVYYLLKTTVAYMAATLNTNTGVEIVKLSATFEDDLLEIAQKIVSKQIDDVNKLITPLANQSESTRRVELTLKQHYVVDTFAARYFKMLDNLAREMSFGRYRVNIYGKKTHHLYLNGSPDDRQDTLFASEVLRLSNEGFYLKPARLPGRIFHAYASPPDKCMVEIGAQCKYRLPDSNVIPSPDEVEKVIQVIRPS